MASIYHLVGRDDWASATQPYAPPSLAREGFVHCCTASQLRGVVARFHAGRDDLVLVELDPDRLDVPVVWEDTHGHGEAFPHVYGAIPEAAVVDVRPYAAG